MTGIADLLAAVIRGEIPPWPSPGDTEFAGRVLKAAEMHGVNALLHDRLGTTAGGSDWPESVMAGLRKRTLGSSAWELAHRQEIAKVLAAMEEQGLKPLLFKGSVLAYTHYRLPWLRSRGDTDLMIAPAELGAASEAFAKAGYKRNFAISGEHVSYQATFVPDNPPPAVHAFDLHWQVNNAPVLAARLDYADLLARSQPVPALDANARGPNEVDSLLLACLHRAAHLEGPRQEGMMFSPGDRLLWLYDILLLFNGLDTAARGAFADRAINTGLAGISLDTLETTQRILCLQIDENLRNRLAEAGKHEPASQYLHANQMRRAWINLSALGDWRARARYLGENFLPSADYMRQRYPESAGQPLAWLYLKRGFTGVGKKLRR